MENASKALILAGSILLGILVLSLGVYVYNMFANFSSKAEQTLSTQEVENFNSKLTPFANRKDITINEIISVANLAKENNKKYGLTGPNHSDGSYYLKIDLNAYGTETGDTKNYYNDDDTPTSESTKPIDNLEKVVDPDDTLYYDYEIIKNIINLNSIQTTSDDGGITYKKYKYYFECTACDIGTATKRVNHIAFGISQYDYVDSDGDGIKEYEITTRQLNSPVPIE